MFENALDARTVLLINTLSEIPLITENFYLAEGTALSLHLGHRTSEDLVNDRVYRYGKSIHSFQGFVRDNEIDICANKLCAIIGQDEPKDMFDLHTIFSKGKIDWKTAITAAVKKCTLDPEVLEYRLSSFPL